MTDEDFFGPVPKATVAAPQGAQTDQDFFGPAPATQTQPKRSWLGWAGHMAGVTGEALGRGLEHIAGAPGDVEHLARWGANKLGIDVSPENATLFGSPLAPTSEQIHQNSLRDTIGGVHMLGNFTPEGAGEELWSKGVENLVPGTAGGLGLGMRLAPAIGSAIGSTVGGEVGKAATGGSALGEIAGEMLGGGVGAVGAHAATKPNVENLLKNFGASENKQAAGEATKATFRDFLQQENTLNEPANKAAFLASGAEPKTLPEREVAAWSKVDAKFPNPHTDVGGDAKPLYDIFDSLSSAGGPASAGVKKTAPGSPRIAQYKEALDNATDNGKVPLTWSDIRDLKTQIGSEINNDTIENKPSDALKALYKGASKIIDNMATAAGATDELAAANQATRDLQAYKDQVISKYLGKPGTKADIAGGNVASRILGGAKGDSRELDLIAQNSPQAVNELMGGMLREDPRMWTKFNAQSQNALTHGNVDLQQRLTDATSPLRPRSPADEVRRLQWMEALGTVGQNLGDLLGWQQIAGEPTMHDAGRALGVFAPLVTPFIKNTFGSPAFPRGAAVGGALGLTEPEWFHPEAQ